MAVNFHQPSVHALLDVMPVPMLTFGQSGNVTFANKAAKAHAGNPVEAMGDKPVIKSIVRDMGLGKIKLPYAAEVELKNGLKVKGSFMAGLSGLDIAFLIVGEAAASETHRQAGLGDVIGLLKDEISPHLKRLSSKLGQLPESPAGLELETSAQELDMRLRRLGDLITVFGDDVLISDDRVDIVDVFKSVCLEIGPRAQAKKVQIELKEPQLPLPALYGNAQMIRRALFECMDNAVQHSRREVNSKQDLSISISFAVTGEHVLVVIVNQGAIIVPEDQIETRDALSRHTEPGSNGRLGLPLVQRIVGLFGGNMRMKNNGDDEVRVMLEFPTGAPIRGQARIDIAQAQRYAADLAQLMSRRRKEAA